MNNFGRFSIVGAIFLFFFCTDSKTSKEDNKTQPPNIIYILADDLGFGDIQFLNPESKYPTPNIDELARRGKSYTNFHTNSAVCTPTRYGIMTGRYAWRSSLKSGTLSSLQPSIIDSGRKTVAHLLKENGYKTVAIGKWHLGMSIPMKDGEVDLSGEISNGPVDFGFEHYFGIPASLDLPPYFYINNKKIVEKPTVPGIGFGRKGLAAPSIKPENVLPELTQKAVQTIEEYAEENSKKPLFLYFPLTAPHTPVAPSEGFKGTTNSAYGDFITQVDHVVGKIMKAISANNMNENTLIIFTADNGASPAAAKTAIANNHIPNNPFRGGKTLLWEGGHRVPFIAHWHNVIKSGTTSNDLFGTTDFMATVADILKVQLSENEGEDSKSMLPSLIGNGSGRERYVYHSGSGFFAFTSGKYKLITVPGGGGWAETHFFGREFIPIDSTLNGQLYDIYKDPSETNNLYQIYPDIVDSLRKELKRVVLNGRSTTGNSKSKEFKYWDQLDTFWK